jgi:NitT/TauT family transport system ATP-binding protein
MELQEIWNEHQITTVLVTHSVEEAVLLAERVIVMSARPGTVLVDQSVPFPYPRTRALLTQPAFHEIADSFLAALDGEAAGV